MVSHAIDSGLIERIQNFVAKDINQKIVMRGEDKIYEVKPEDVYILSFERVLNNWTAIATAEADVNSFYKIVHDGSNRLTMVTIYIIHGYPTQEII